MKSMASRSAALTPENTNVHRAATVGLRKGKIHATKASASEIRRAIGVTPADERVAARALLVAATKPKTKSRVSRTAKKTEAKSRTKPAPQKR